LATTERIREILSWYGSDSPGTLTNLARMLSAGTLGGSGRMVILPVDQGFEHGPARSFAPNPAGYDPRYHFELAIETGCNAYAAPLGFLEADMRRLFLLEGVTIGAAGSALGWLLGFSMIYALSLVRFEINATGQEMTHLPIAWSLMHYIIASSFAVGSAAVAGYLPARRAARLNPVDIIRGAT